MCDETGPPTAADDEWLTRFILEEVPDWLMWRKEMQCQECEGTGVQKAFTITTDGWTEYEYPCECRLL